MGQRLVGFVDDRQLDHVPDACQQRFEERDLHRVILDEQDPQRPRTSHSGQADIARVEQLLHAAAKYPAMPSGGDPGIQLPVDHHFLHRGGGEPQQLRRLLGG